MGAAPLMKAQRQRVYARARVDTTNARNSRIQVHAAFAVAIHGLG